MLEHPPHPLLHPPRLLAYTSIVLITIGVHLNAGLSSAMMAGGCLLFLMAIVELVVANR